MKKLAYKQPSAQNLVSVACLILGQDRRGSRLCSSAETGTIKCQPLSSFEKFSLLKKKRKKGVKFTSYHPVQNL